MKSQSLHPRLAALFLLLVPAVASAQSTTKGNVTVTTNMTVRTNATAWIGGQTNYLGHQTNAPATAGFRLLYEDGAAGIFRHQSSRTNISWTWENWSPGLTIYKPKLTLDGSDRLLLHPYDNLSTNVTPGVVIDPSTGVSVGGVKPLLEGLTNLVVTGPISGDGAGVTNLGAGSFTGLLGLAQGGTGAGTAGGARTNLGLGDVATKNTGTAAGTVATGNDNRIVRAVQTNAAFTTMTGRLNLPVNGLNVATNHLVVTNTFVGVGTNNPAYKLEVNGLTNLYAARFTGNSNAGVIIAANGTSMTGVIDFQNAATGTTNWHRIESLQNGGMTLSALGTNTGYIAFVTTGTNGVGERVRISAGGSLGLGTNAPGAMLHVVGGARLDGPVRLAPGGAFDMGPYTAE